MYFNRWRAKQTDTATPWNPTQHLKDRTWNMQRFGWISGHSAQLENKPTSKGHILDDCIHITFSKWQCNREEKQTHISRSKEWWRTERLNYKSVAHLQWWNSFVFLKVITQICNMGWNDIHTLWQSQFPDIALALQLCEILPMQKLNEWYMDFSLPLWVNNYFKI